MSKEVLSAKPTSVQFPRDVHTEVKAHLSGTGISISAWLAKAAREIMAQEQQTGTHKMRRNA